jgi:hypothetical protein
MARKLSVRERWEMTTPLGRPVVPDVYWMHIASHSSTVTCGRDGDAAASQRSYSSPRTTIVSTLCRAADRAASSSDGWTMSSCACASSQISAISATEERALTVTVATPTSPRPATISGNSMQFGARMAAWAPGSRPAPTDAAVATRSMRCTRSRKLRVRSSSRSATLSGRRPAAARSPAPRVRGR